MTLDGESPAQVVTIGAVAVLVIMKCFELLKMRRQRNGHSAPNPATVEPKDAMDFWQLHQGIRRDVRAIARKLHVTLEDD